MITVGYWTCGQCGQCCGHVQFALLGGGSKIVIGLYVMDMWSVMCVS